MEPSIRMHRFETIRSTCRYVEGQRLWFGKASLTATAVKVTGWLGFRRYVRRVLLDDLQSVSRRPETIRSNIAFRLMDSSIWSAEVSAPGLWRIEAAQRIRAINPDRAGDGDEVIMSVSSYPPVAGPVVDKPTFRESIIEEPPIEEIVAEESVAEEPVAEESPIEEIVAEESVAEEPVAEEPIVEEPDTDDPAVGVPIGEWLAGSPSLSPSAAVVPEIAVEFADPVPVNYSLTEAYSAAVGPVEPEAPWADPEPEPSDVTSSADLEQAPGWRPIHLFVSGKRVATGWKPIDDLDSRGMAGN